MMFDHTNLQHHLKQTLNCRNWKWKLNICISKAQKLLRETTSFNNTYCIYHFAHISIQTVLITWVFFYQTHTYKHLQMQVGWAGNRTTELKFIHTLSQYCSLGDKKVWYWYWFDICSSQFGQTMTTTIKTCHFSQWSHVLNRIWNWQFDLITFYFKSAVGWLLSRQMFPIVSTDRLFEDDSHNRWSSYLRLIQWMWPLVFNYFYMALCFHICQRYSVSVSRRQTHLCLCQELIHCRTVSWWLVRGREWGPAVPHIDAASVAMGLMICCSSLGREKKESNAIVACCSL